MYNAMRLVYHTMLLPCHAVYDATCVPYHARPCSELCHATCVPCNAMPCSVPCHAKPCCVPCHATCVPCHAMRCTMPCQLYHAVPFHAMMCAIPTMQCCVPYLGHTMPCTVYYVPGQEREREGERVADMEIKRDNGGGRMGKEEWDRENG